MKFTLETYCLNEDSRGSCQHPSKILAVKANDSIFVIATYSMGKEPGCDILQFPAELGDEIRLLGQSFYPRGPAPIVMPLNIDLCSKLTKEIVPSLGICYLPSASVGIEIDDGCGLARYLNQAGIRGDEGTGDVVCIGSDRFLTKPDTAACVVHARPKDSDGLPGNPWKKKELPDACLTGRTFE